MSRLFCCRYLDHRCRTRFRDYLLHLDLRIWCHAGTGFWGDSRRFGLALVRSFTSPLLLGRHKKRTRRLQFPSRIFYIQLIIYGALFPVLLLFTSETRGPVIQARLAKLEPKFAHFPIVNRPSSQAASMEPTTSAMERTPSAQEPVSIRSLLYTATIRPFHMLLTEPVVAAFTLWSAFCFGIVYTCIQSIAQIYENYYGFTDAQSGFVDASNFSHLP